MLRFFRSNQPASLLGIILLSVVIWLVHFFTHASPAPVTDHSMPFYNLFVNFIVRGNAVIGFILSMAVVIGGGFMLNFLMGKNEMLRNPTYLPVFIYVILMGSSGYLYTLHPVMFSNIFLMLALYNLLGAYRKETSFAEIFNAGLALSVAALFYFPVVCLFPFIFVALVVLRPFIWREWIISILGFITPWLFALSWYFINDELGYFLNAISLHSGHSLQMPELSGASYFKLISLLSISGLSFAAYFYLNTGQKIVTKSAYMLLIWFVVLNVPLILVFPQMVDYSLALLVFPASVYITHYFVHVRRVAFGELMFWWLITVLIVNFF